MSKRRRRHPISQDPVTTKVESLNHEGRGVTRINGKTTFLFGALPEETVQFKYTQQRSQFDEGEVDEVIEPHPQRVTPACQYFAHCGGCSWQHADHTLQLQHKQNTLLELLTHQAQIVPQEILAPLTGPLWGYRHKARISTKYVARKNKTIIGFRERKSHLVADLDSCQILHPAIGGKFKEFALLIESLTMREHIRQFEIAVADDANAVIIRHMQPLPADDLAKLTAFAQQHGIKFYLQPKGLDSIQLLCPKSHKPECHYALPDYNLNMAFLPWQFTQINPAINQKMIKQALQLLELTPTDHVLDLFCGIGNFSLPLARYCQHVVGVEGDSSSVIQANRNAENNQLPNCTFYTANLFDDIDHAAWAQSRYNKILLDPPRAGAQELVQQIARWQASHIVYVSCNPATLARDAKHLEQQGYVLAKAGIIDMFPHTQHVEAISLFKLK